MFKLKDGFSLIEMLVVMSITLVLSAILIGYSREAGRQLLLISSQAKVVNLISRAKSLSVATFIDTNGLPASGESKICGYGVHVDKELGQVFIFRDLAVDCSDSASSSYRVFSEGSDEKLQGTLDLFSLPDTIQFGTATDTTLINVLFIPPDPTIIINKGASQLAQVTLQSSKGGNLNFVVKIDDAGKISTK